MTFFAGLISLLAGGMFLLLWSVPLGQIGPRFHRLISYLSLTGWTLILLMIAPETSRGWWQFGVAAAMLPVLLLYAATVGSPRGRSWRVLYGFGTLLNLTWFTLLGYSLAEVFPAGAGVSAWLYALQMVLSAAVLGAIVDAMICGHWYLVNRGLGLGPIRSVSRALGAVLAAKLILLTGLLYGLSGSRPHLFERVVFAFPVLFWVRILVGLGGGLLFDWMSWKALEYDNTQAATGILYACITWIVMGEFSAFYLTVQTGVPL